MHRPRHPGKHYSERTLRIHSFVLSFSLSVLLLTSVLSATLVSGGFWDLNRSLSVKEEILPAAGNTDGVPITTLTDAEREDGLTVLVMGVKDAESIANTYLLVRFDPLRGRIPVTSLPPQTLTVKLWLPMFAVLKDISKKPERDVTFVI